MPAHSLAKEHQPPAAAAAAVAAGVLPQAQQSCFDDAAAH